VSEPLETGVIGVGSMGRNHARVYTELPGAELVGVADADVDRAWEVADEYETTAMDPHTLLQSVDAVSIAVPTRYHYDTAREAIGAGVGVLIEKPFVDRPADGRRLIEQARDLDVTLQVGHIERFNPAVRALAAIVPDLDVIAVDAMRLGPPVDREIDVSPVLDLMIHDIDVVRSIADSDVADLCATAAAEDPYVTATLSFDGGVLGTLTASRVTQEKVRSLSITARDCRVTLDYIDQSIEIHRQSLPEWVQENGDVSFRHRNIVEHPTVKNGEPLQAELGAFVESVVTGSDPLVTGEDGLEAVRIAHMVSEAAGIEADLPEPAVEQ
jgi:predicted dehydrogenase